MKFSDGEKLIIMMLAEIYEHVGIKGEIDPKFVQSAIYTGNVWGLAWKYPGIFDASEANKTVRDETLNLLQMWHVLERSYNTLSVEDKKRVDTDVAPYANPRFMGFDGNAESDYINITRFLIDHLERYSDFKGRSLDSHPSSLGIHRRMYTVYEQLRPSFGDGMSAEQIISVIKEQVHPSHR